MTCWVHVLSMLTRAKFLCHLVSQSCFKLHTKPPLATAWSKCFLVQCSSAHRKPCIISYRVVQFHSFSYDTMHSISHHKTLNCLLSFYYILAYLSWHPWIILHYLTINIYTQRANTYIPSRSIPFHLGKL